jgi:poly-beta-1,6-N-acetyl-D-glucosamine synthase
VNLTIGICAHNEAKNIESLLVDVLNQKDLPSTSRIIVVASGCTDNTVDIVREIKKRESRVELVEEENRTGKTNAINLILERSSPGLVVLVAADVRLRGDSVSQILRALVDRKIAVVGGLPVVMNCESGIVAKSAAAIWRVMRRAMIELGPKGDLSFVMGELYCFRTDLVKRIPIEIVNDDAYIATYARNKGFKVVHAERADFLLKVPSSITDYVAQRRRVTFGHLQIRNQMGRFANIEGILLDHPRTMMGAMIREAASHPQSVVCTLFLIELEFVIRLLAFLDLRSGRQHVMWRKITTTK